ncbi:hypothetical protein OB2597_00325 [Pseudooceanicola batsensis HTCC2597]|uniref:Uncharacterized protein n=1 Tax=Pseudooceanicola batsensis (strain ATCC BAA-863 / DSM 15984 / KCTC 12145 / HTCC2597) TaxID=252305 RepID=A3U1N5_PSEBH|nr:hypothetical protein [Pseudooceanicola batsensis]EAQ01816.1 hypothetical protein OB2597_00325 [Pseudooceanicola batsensis HTCC2597]
MSHAPQSGTPMETRSVRSHLQSIAAGRAVVSRVLIGEGHSAFRTAIGRPGVAVETREVPA